LPAPSSPRRQTIRKRNNRPRANVLVQKLRRGKRKNRTPQLDQMSQLYHPVKLLNYVQVAIAYLQDLC